MEHPTQPLPQVNLEQQTPAHYEAQHRHPDDIRHTRRQLLVTAGVVIAAVSVNAYIWRDEFYSGDDAPQGDASDSSHESNVEASLALPPEFDKSREVNLLDKGTWKFMPGADQQNDKLHMRKTGLALRTLPDTWKSAAPEYEADPPINIYGTHLKTDGKDFGLAATVSGVTEQTPAIMNFYSEPDFTYDERRYYQPKTQVAVYPDRIVVQVWRGKGPEADEKEEMTFKTPLQQNGFWLKQEGGKVIVSSNQRQVAFDTDMFKATGEVWFGADGTFILESLKAYPAQEGGKVESVDTSTLRLGAPIPGGLQAEAARQRKDMLVGAAMNMTPMAEYAMVSDTIGKHFGALKPEMDGKMNAIYLGAPGPDGRVDPKDFDWSRLDAFVDLARRNDRKFHLHTLAFGEAMPAPVEKFLQDVATGKRPIAHALNFIDSYAKEYLGRYPDAAAVDVVNELLADTEVFDDAAGIIFNENAWYKAFGGKNGGERYIEAWCAAARKHGAKKIFINENGMETWDERARVMINIAAPLRKKGLVDGVGLQAHLREDDLSIWIDDDKEDDQNVKIVHEAISARFAQFARNGLEVQVSELSMDVYDPHWQAMAADGLMRAAIRSRNVSAVYLWSPINGPWAFTAEPNGNYDIEVGNDGPWDWDDNRKQVVAKQTLGGYHHGLTA